MIHLKPNKQNQLWHYENATETSHLDSILDKYITGKYCYVSIRINK